MLRWLKKRWRAHLAIGLVFFIPMLAVLEWGAKNPFLYVAKVRLDGMEADSVNYRMGLLRKAHVNPNLVFLAIDMPSVAVDSLDDQTIAASQPLSVMHTFGFPYHREVYADICERLLGAGARVVTFDINFQKPSANDPPFRQVLEKYPNQIVIGMNFNDDLANGRASTFSLPPSTLEPNQDPMDSLIGFLNFWPDPDGVVRKAQYRTNAEHVDGQTGAEKFPKFYSLAARTLQNSGHPYVIPDDLDSRSIRFASILKIPKYSLFKIFDPHSWAVDFKNGNYFKNKIVLIGPMGDWAKDELVTPFGQMDGAQIHFNAMNSLLENEFLYPPSDWFTCALVLYFSLVAFLLAMGIPSIALRFLAALAVIGGYGATLAWAYNGPGWLLPVVGPIGVFAGTTSVGFIYDFLLAQIEKLQLRATFERYTSPNVAKYLLDHAESYTEMLAGARKPVTVLFSDVRNFTTMTEVAAAKGESQQHVAKLNEYLTAMVACVFRQDGSLDKFIGDAVMAVWGNTPYNFGPKEDAVRAVKAALEMNKELIRVNEGWAAQGREPWHIGIGLNHGEVIVGDMGSQQRKEFAVLGDAVNLASRLESLTKEFQVEILLGESVAGLVRDRFHLRSVDLVVVKGKTEAVDTFTVIGDISVALSPEKQKFLGLYEDGIRAFRSRGFAKARELFSQALQAEPGDHLAKEYLKSCVECIQNPPDETWTGVRVMTKK